MSSIDIVVPCYRYAHYLRACVQSVLSQGIPDLRVLIIDDQSPDNTPEVGAALAREDSRVTYRRHAVNLGHISTYNEGIDWIEADCMLLLSADDYLLPGALQRALDLMASQPNMALVLGQAVELHDNGLQRLMRIDVDSKHASPVVLSGAEFVNLVARAGAVNVVPTPTAVVKSALLKQLGGYRSDLPHSGDLELWLRLAVHGSVGVVNQEQAVYRRHTANMSSGYLQDSCLFDLQQRRDAFDIFLQQSQGVMSDAPQLHRKLLEALASEAVVHASQAFNDNRLALSRQLCDFATSASPEVRHSLAWHVVAGKALLGFRLASALLPWLSRVRRVKARLLGFAQTAHRR